MKKYIVEYLEYILLNKLILDLRLSRALIFNRN